MTARVDVGLGVVAPVRSPVGEAVVISELIDDDDLVDSFIHLFTNPLWRAYLPRTQ